MAEQDSVWYRLGYTIEKARQKVPGTPKLRSLEERQEVRKVSAPPRRRPAPEPRPAPRTEPLDATPDEPSPAPGGVAALLEGVAPTGEKWEAVLAAAATALVGVLLETMPRRRSLGPFRLLRAAAAGAGASLVREMIRPITSGQPSTSPLVERARSAALSGSARGLLYGVLIDPRIPGPPVLRGAAYGALEHLVSPLGGLTALAGPLAPHRRLPFGELLEDTGPGDASLWDHILFGVALAALYGAAPPDEDDDDEDD